MPQREKVKLIDLKDVNIQVDIGRMWREGVYRPTVVVIGSRSVTKGIYEIPFVNYDNAHGGAFMPLQRAIEKEQSVHRATWLGLDDAFDMKLPSTFRHPPAKCYSAYDYACEKGRIPDGFTVGKRYYFAEVNLDGVSLEVKDVDKQKDKNPVLAISQVSGLGSIRASLYNLREEKRWMLNDVITDALHRRWERDKLSFAA